MSSFTSLLQFVSLLGLQTVLFLRLEAQDNIVCPNIDATSYPNTTCPSTSLGCCKIEYSLNGYGCAMEAIDVPGLIYCCMPGPLKGPIDGTNVMVLGDSVSIGYTPYVVDFFQNLNDNIQVCIIYN